MKFPGKNEAIKRTLMRYFTATFIKVELILCRVTNNRVQWNGLIETLNHSFYCYYYQFWNIKSVAEALNNVELCRYYQYSREQEIIGKWICILYLKNGIKYVYNWLHYIKSS